MRAAFLGLIVSAMTVHTAAADFLRGSTYDGPPKRSYNWNGVYVGAQGGYANTDFAFGNATRGMVANELRETIIENRFNASGLVNLPKRDGRGVSYGGFIGYNKQWGDVVLGLELNYNRTDISASANDYVARFFVDSDSTPPMRYDVSLDSQVTARLTDYASIRFRAGYAMDWLMPYLMVGASVGNVHYAKSVIINEVESDNTDPGSPVAIGGLGTVNLSEARNNALTGGFMLGGGVDLGLTRNLFLRAEYEYMYLAPVGGISFHVNTIRGAAALKF